MLRNSQFFTKRFRQTFGNKSDIRQFLDYKVAAPLIEKTYTEQSFMTKIPNDVILKGKQSNQKVIGNC